MDDRQRSERLGLSDALRKVSSGAMERRDFLRLCSATGWGFAAMTLPGCQMLDRVFRNSKRGEITPHVIRESEGPASASNPSTDQHRFLTSVGRSFSGTKLRIIGENTPPSVATLAILKSEFTPLTGIEVEWEQAPLHQVLAAVLSDTARKAGQYDIYYWDQAWVGRFAGESVDPRALLARKDLAYPGFDFEDFLPPLVAHVASYKGQMVGIPFDIPIWIMIYRKDILKKLGLAVPKTIPDYLKLVESVQAAKIPGVYGTTEGWKSGHYTLLQKSCTWLWGHGGSFFGADERPTIVDENAQAGMEFMLRLGKSMPPAVTTWDWFGEAQSFARGNAAIYIGIGEFFPSYDNPAESEIVGLAEPAPSPKAISLRPASACGFDEVPGMSHHGGSCLAVSRYGRHIDASWVFLQWATSSDVTTRASLLGGGASPIRFSNYRDPRILAKNRVTTGTTRHFAVTLDAIQHHLGTEPHLPEWPALADQFAIELGRMTTDQQSVKETLRNMSKAADRAREGHL